jgi:DNA-binding CsgD family transcriptional regulator
MSTGTRARGDLRQATVLGLPPAILLSSIPGALMVVVVRTHATTVAGISFHSLGYALLGTAALAIGLAVSALAARRVIACGSTLALLDALAFAAMCVGGVTAASPDPLVSTAVPTAFFIGDAWMALRWGSLLTVLDGRRLARAVMCSSIVCCLAVRGLTVVNSPLALIFLAAACLIALRHADEGLGCPGTLGALVRTVPAGKDAGRKRIDAHADVTEYRRELAMLAAGTLAYGLVLMMRKKMGYAYEGLTDTFSTLLAVAIATCCLVDALRPGGHEWSSPDLQRVACSLLAAFALGAFLTPLTADGTDVILDAVMGAVILTLPAVLIALCAHVAVRASLHPFLVFGTCLALYGVPRLLCPLLIGSSSDIAFVDGGQGAFYQTLILVMTATAAMAFLTAGTSPWRAAAPAPGYAAGAAAETTSPDGAPTLEAAASGIADEHGLTKRETQVMELICRGRSKPLIAEACAVSENTVRAYTKSLYSKLGVHSKQELIDLVERWERSSGGKAGHSAQARPQDDQASS